MESFLHFLSSFDSAHPVATVLILIFGFPEIEIILLILLGLLAFSGR